MADPLLQYSYLVTGVLEIAVPLLLGYFITRRYGVSWRVYEIGCVMFLVSLIRIPVNQAIAALISDSFSGGYAYLLLIAFPSLTAGLFEESVRYVSFKFLVKEHDYRHGLMYGAGHGGIESIVLVGLNSLALVLILAYSQSSIPSEQLNMIAASPPYIPFLGLYERFMAIVIQLGLSVMVMESFSKQNNLYFMAAVFIHFLVNFVTLILLPYGIFVAEFVVTLFALGFYLYLRHVSSNIVGSDRSSLVGKENA